MSGKMNRLGPSGIEYLDKVWNFYSGCRHKEEGKCPPGPCWAEKFVGRFEDRYPNGFEPTFYPEAFLSPLALKKPSRIGVCFMGDLFGDWVDPQKIFFSRIQFDITKLQPIGDAMNLTSIIRSVIRLCPQHTFVFPTKNPSGMKAWGQFPANCEVGFSAWDANSFMGNLRAMVWGEVEAKVRWCSLEPLLDWNIPAGYNLELPMDKEMPWKGSNPFSFLDWVALGALIGTRKEMEAVQPQYPALTLWKLGKGNRWGLMPPVSWLQNIVEQCDDINTKVFIKNNLWSWLVEKAKDTTIFNKAGQHLPFKFHCTLRQEYGAVPPEDRPDLRTIEQINADDAKIEAECKEKAKAAGHTEKEIEDCADGSLGCPGCPWDFYGP